jgi:lipopolysaccharide transport system ATP-binding protein
MLERMTDKPLCVRASKVGKCYQRVHEKPMLLREAAMLFAGRRRQVDELWAVRYLDFELRQGDTLGVIGANGSGKSTLLALVAGTCFPTEGTMSTRGRIATLLSLGAGFHPDMTGEENIVASAALLGVPVDEARKLTRKIIEFAELDSAIDTPVRTYSSGMSGRLGFSVAINVSPDILVVDEIFAVGDLAFQAKCIAEVKRLQATGITMVFASQSPQFLADFCTRAVWLEKGQVKMIGSASEVGEAYHIAMTGEGMMDRWASMFSPSH